MPGAHTGPSESPLKDAVSGRYLTSAKRHGTVLRLGWGLMGEATPFGADRRAFGHGGAGGSLGFGDLDGSIGFGYVMNRMGADSVGDLRAFTLLAAVYESL